MRAPIFKFIAFFWLAMAGLPAHAILGEVRLHFGSANGEPDQYNKGFYNFQDGPKIDSQKYLGGDAILMPPVLPIGIGLRYEITGDDQTQYAQKVDYTIKRTALVVNYRIVDTLMYLGPIATYGLSHDLQFKIPTDPDAFKAGGDKSYSIGLEAGAKLGLFRFGVEAGYMSLVFDKLTDLGGATPTKNGVIIDELDFSGTYYKLHVGIGF